MFGRFSQLQHGLQFVPFCRSCSHYGQTTTDWIQFLTINNSRKTEKQPQLSELNSPSITVGQTHGETTEKQPPLFISFSTLVFASILLHTYLPTAVPTVPGAVKVVVISLSFPSLYPQSINLSNSLVVGLLLMLPLFGMLFLMRFVFRKCLKTYIYIKAYPP